jgi:L-cysteine:1D-myo-inositol 2-amino-2-deoxy-alpha-D-glucopyranoside ligase
MQTLNVRPPDHFPGATDVIPEIIDIVSQLLEADLAYEAGGNVYFHVNSWAEFGRLSRIPRADMLPVANERGNRPDDPHKQDPLDFVLWQAQTPGEPAWESPWGAGRPGWHIECSTMATSLLGETIDIHGGGGDLIFPHHECEIAQAEGATGNHPFVRFWMHAAMVHHDGEKMSKSLGNLVMARDLLKEWSPDAIRLYLARHHYRQPWSYDEAELAQAGQLARKLTEAATAVGGQDSPLDPSSVKKSFDEAMDNDLNTPQALASLGQLAERTIAAAGEGGDVQEAQQALRRMGQVFGLRLNRPESEARVLSGWNEHLARFTEA